MVESRKNCMFAACHLLCRKKVPVLFALLLLLFPFYTLLTPSQARAGNASDSYLRFDRMKAATTPGNLLLVFTTSADSATEASFRLSLDSEWVSATHFSATSTDWTFTTTGIPAGTTAMPISGSNGTVSGNNITFSLSGALSSSTSYAFIITGGLLTNPAASSTIVHTLATLNGSSAVIDSILISSPTISDDQISVTASVDPSFTIAFTNNTEALGVLNVSSVSSSPGEAITVTTNAANGWTMWAKSENAGLSSASTGYTIDTAGSIDGTPSTLSQGTEGYVLDVNSTTNGSGSLTVAAEYNGADTSSGGTLSTSLQQIASATDPTSTDTVTLVLRAAIEGLTPAASDYTDTITVVGAGVF